MLLELKRGINFLLSKLDRFTFGLLKVFWSLMVKKKIQQRIGSKSKIPQLSSVPYLAVTTFSSSRFCFSSFLIYLSI